jgi:uncharacterized protein YndB with AHSA1/START domain
MKTYGVSRTTSATPDAVWRLWSDPNNWSAWNSGIAEAKLNGPLANGTTGAMTTTQSGTHQVTFHDVVPGHCFSLSMGGPPLTTITFGCSIEPHDTGSTIEQHVSFSGALGFLFGAMMGGQMAQHFVPVLDDLARAAESQTRATN